jgi:hypothetical protein
MLDSARGRPAWAAGGGGVVCPGRGERTVMKTVKKGLTLPAKAGDVWIVPVIVTSVSAVIIAVFSAVFLASFWEDMYQFFDDHVFR